MTPEVKKLLSKAQRAVNDLLWWEENGLEFGSSGRYKDKEYYLDFTETVRKELRDAIEAVKKPTKTCTYCNGKGEFEYTARMVCTDCYGKGRVSKGCD